MSIIWGSWQNTSSNGMRIGYRVSRTSVSSSSSSVTFTVRVYTQNRYIFADDQHIDFGSYLGSRHNFRNSSSGGAVLRATRTYSYSYSDYGTSRTLSSSARVGGVWSGLTPSVTIRLAVPARPYRAPLAPTGLALSSQNSSGAVTLSWTNRRNNGAGRPYTSQRIEYSYYQSTGSWTGWRFLATASASATSYRYTNMYTNSRYQYRIRANNSAGSSGWSGTVATNTVPAAPTNARAAVESTGDSIRVTWTRNNRRGDSVIFHQVQRQTSSSGSWSTVAARLASSTTSWIDTNPNAGYNRYRVRSFVDQTLLTQYSAFSTAASITTIVPPLAPTGLSISPRVPDFARETTISWTHRHGGDGADQSDYILQYSIDGGEWAGVVLGEASHLSSYTIPADTLPNGAQVRLRVATRGNTQEGFGPYSSPLQVEGWTTPTVSIDDAAPAEVVTTIPFIIAWTYNQDEDRAQLRAEVEIWTYLDDEDTGGLDTRILRQVIEGDETSLEVDTILDDGGIFVARVRVTSSREQQSVWSSVIFAVDMLPPALADLRPQYDPETGVMVLEVEPYEPRYTGEGEVLEPIEAAIDNFSVQRRVNAGEWVTIIDYVAALHVYEDEGNEGVSVISLMDLLPAINGRNEYRLHLRSVAPSVADTEPVMVTVTPADNEGWAFLNYGPDMGSVLRVGNNVEVGESLELEGADVPIAGRRRPLSLFGEHETRALSVTGQLYHDELHTAPSSQSPLDSPPDDWRQAQREANTVCLRTPAGHRIYGRMTGLDLTTSNLNVTRLSFSVVENDFREEESTGAGVEVGH